MNSHNLYIRAVMKWGNIAQMHMMIEECAELIKALMKIDRNRNNTTIDEVLEEMADVEIMLEQMKITFNYKYSNGAVDKFEDIKKMKLNRLEKLLDEVP